MFLFHVTRHLGLTAALCSIQDNYLQQRSTAIEGIESTIAELGGIFQQLAHMVQQQGETVQRIDVDTSDIANNVQGAQRELLRYYTNMSGNRALMLKVFGVLIVFFVSSSQWAGLLNLARSAYVHVLAFFFLQMLFVALT